MNSEGRGFLAQMDHPSINHSCVFLYWLHCPSRKVLFLHETCAYYQCSGWNMTDTSPISPISFVSRKPRFPLLELHQSWRIQSSSNPKSCHSIRSLSIILCSSSDTFQTTLGPGNTHTQVPGAQDLGTPFPQGGRPSVLFWVCYVYQSHSGQSRRCHLRCP